MTDEQRYFLDPFQKGIYCTILNMTLEDVTPYDIDDVANFSYIIKRQRFRFIETPEKFFEKWLNGRIGRKPDLLQYHDGKGFELQLPEVKTKIVRGKTFKKIEGLVIVSDFGYSGDFGEDTVFAINDTESKKVFTYRDENSKNLKNDPLCEKKLTEGPIYEIGEIEKYPFTSISPIKSAPYTWTMVKITPEEVYGALKKVGFVW